MRRFLLPRYSYEACEVHSLPMIPTILLHYSVVSNSRGRWLLKYNATKWIFWVYIFYAGAIIPASVISPVPFSFACYYSGALFFLLFHPYYRSITIVMIIIIIVIIIIEYLNTYITIFKERRIGIIFTGN